MGGYLILGLVRLLVHFGTPRELFITLLGLHLLIPGSASLAIQHAFSKPCLVKFISKDTHLVFSISHITNKPLLPRERDIKHR